jgi:hypothetical protein
MNDLQIGPESLNLAVTPFLNDLAGWQNDCKLHLSGAVGNIYRPTLSLFIALKMKRASTIDLADIREALKKWPAQELDESKLSLWFKPEQLKKYLAIKQHGSFGRVPKADG